MKEFLFMVYYAKLFNIDFNWFSAPVLSTLQCGSREYQHLQRGKTTLYCRFMSKISEMWRKKADFAGF